LSQFEAFKKALEKQSTAARLKLWVFEKRTFAGLAKAAATPVLEEIAFLMAQTNPQAGEGLFTQPRFSLLLSFINPWSGT